MQEGYGPRDTWQEKMRLCLAAGAHFPPLLVLDPIVARLFAERGITTKQQLIDWCAENARLPARQILVEKRPANPAADAGADRAWAGPAAIRRAAAAWPSPQSSCYPSSKLADRRQGTCKRRATNPPSSSAPEPA
jgi:hypothetical protein